MRFTTVALALLFASVAFGMTGCSSSGSQKASRTVSSLEDLSGELNAGIQQIDTTFGALDDLVGMSGGDLQRGFDRYTRELGRLESQADRIASRADDMRRRASAFYEAWAAELDNVSSSQIRDLSEERRELAMQRIEALQAQMVAGREAYDPMMTELQDIRTFLEFNLNPGGVEVIQPIANQARADGEIVKEALRGIAAVMDQLSSGMSSRQ